ncbi:hypothetical protein [Neobacillus citreus]|uniref:Uncharacterized protein n=1 Tax=Neobacillus citreus TaxID=2833578 RepID=A0A942SWE1_9BACI|nr:hypothetical protein [Neobacillus citreus]MCH6265703.1 hypothetical protein [Neobacillus citreus]
MEQKPVHYDGSFHLDQAENEAVVKEPFLMTDEMRKNIGKNPYSMEVNE